MKDYDCLRGQECLSSGGCRRYSEPGCAANSSANRRTCATACDSADQSAHCAQADGVSDSIAGLISSLLNPGIANDGVDLSAELNLRQL